MNSPKRKLKSLMRVLLEDDYCPIHYSLFKAEHKPSSHTLHSFATKGFMKGYEPWLRWLLIVCCAITWPLRVIRNTIHLNKRWAHDVTKMTGKNRYRQFIEQLYLSLFSSTPAQLYYQHGGYRSSNINNLSHYLYSMESYYLNSALNDAKVNKCIPNKQMFITFCHEKRLACTPTSAVFSKGQAFTVAGQSLPKMPNLKINDWVIKPSLGSRAQGCEKWSTLPDQKLLCSTRGQTLSVRELWQDCLSKSYKKDLLLQPHLSNHPQLDAIAPGKLICVRLLTTLSNDYDYNTLKRVKISIIAAVLKIPYGEMWTNTLGLISAIDLDNGVAGRAYTYKPTCTGTETHPDTEQRINNVQLPFWDETKELAKQAHLCFPESFSLGWDIAITENGPVLLEANSSWDIFTMQKAMQRSLLDTAFKETSLSRIRELTDPAKKQGA